MSFETDLYWLLLLPVFFGFGWIAGRQDMRHVVSEVRRLPHAYFAGLSHLLRGERDRAIAAYSELVVLDNNAVEVQLTLADLYRQKGEWRKAIHLHQQALNNTELPDSLRHQAQHELALDYFGAGIWDRAENHFLALRSTEIWSQCIGYLVKIYSHEKKWKQAIDLLHQEPHHDALFYRRVAHFYCEMAEHQHSLGDIEQRNLSIHLAEENHPLGVRAVVLKGQWQFDSGMKEQAVLTWHSIEQHDARYLALLSQSFCEHYQTAEKITAGIAFFRQQYQRYPCYEYLVAYAQLLHYQNNAQAAYQWIEQQLIQYPSFISFSQWLKHGMDQHILWPKAVIAEVFFNLVSDKSKQQLQYTCQHCGFAARQFYWQCLACNEWDSYPPLRLLQPQ